MAIYYKVVCSKEHEMNGAGLGYDEIFGNENRYFWNRNDADKAADRLNAIEDDNLRGTYDVEKRKAYGHGTYDDEGDVYAAEQLGMEAAK